ncbi:hypothetical protein QVD17_30695 [Tagetes erecta]|uniref:Uncharacterized protein n=1 Tax=Tagetes erecta TaxID=13708 RepID=A0AAD8NG73_TARER|nr:hypothetical protein QVD17_30695 [Tagetes erecta]
MKKLCSPECAEQIEHYRSYSFRICEKLSKEGKRYNKLKEDHKISTEKILSIQESWKKSLEGIESLKHQLSEISKNFENEKIGHALTLVELSKAKSCKTMVQQLVSERGNKNKTRLGFTHERTPESITNTLPENFNTNDHSPENEVRLKEFLKKKSDEKHQEEESEVEVYAYEDLLTHGMLIVGVADI